MYAICLGPETDDDLFARLRLAVIDLGGTIADSEWVLGGSQEITTYKIVLPTGTLEAVAETYVGLSLQGVESLVTPIAQRVMLNLPLSTDAPAGRRVASTLDVMKKAEFQLVLQFPCNSLEEFDAVVELEDTLMAELSGGIADVDGHDSGSGEANIFILTSEPHETFERAHAVVSRVSHLASVLRAAYRRLDAEEYSVLWPPGETRFVGA